MVNKRDASAPAPAGVVPDLPREVPPSRLVVPAVLRPRALGASATGGARLWEDYAPGETIDHPGAITVEEADHMLATRLYQNTARVHFDAFTARSGQFGKRLVYGGHVISLARALSHDGLENAFAIAARDITERKEAEARLLKEKKFSDSVINSLPGLFYLFDKEGHLLIWNHNMEMLTGYSAEEIANMSPLEFFPVDEQYRIAGRSRRFL